MTGHPHSSLVSLAPAAALALVVLGLLIVFAIGALGLGPYTPVR